MDRRGLLTGTAALVSAVAAPHVLRAQAADELRIGAPLPLTGPLAPEGGKQKRGFDLWAKQVEKTGGLEVGNRKIPVRIVYSDYQSNTPKGVQATEFLITQEKCQLMFAPFGSGAAKAGSSVAERYKVPMMAAAASSKEVYDQGYKFLFGTFTPNGTLTQPLAGLIAATNPGVKKVAILSRNDLLPLSLAAEMRNSTATHGMNIVYDEKFAIGTLDFGSPLTQMQAASPDWIFVGGYTNDLLQVRTQMRDLGLKAPVLTMIAGPAYQDFIDALKGASDNISSAAWWHPAVRYEGEDIFGSTQTYVDAFKTAYGSIPDYGEASASVSGAIFQIAIKKAGSLDPQAIRDALASLNVKTFWGPVHFGPTGQIDSLTPPVFQIQNEKTVVLLPNEIKQGELKFGVG
jgi:branched-chain amino acid transport system substrate-binding protein